MNDTIAIVGMACQYPDAHAPAELWENALARRRAFRRIPHVRLRLDDYYAADPTAPDRIYMTQAAVLADYEFDRMRFRISGPVFRSADFAHWLALEVAAMALDDAGFPHGHGLPQETTGVILGNTLTGEFSRANTMRLRWPYVRRTLDAALIKRGWSPQERSDFLANLEIQYKAPFPSINEESLAGGLSNTIAGRVCNHFDLKGGGYTVDGACASSLLAITNACTALAMGDLDVVLAGGVDLSIDPFELIGFAKTSALAPEMMRVYDKRSAGFWPGEGCGFVVLMRHEDALAQHLTVHALIKGWGVSSDGSGGITRPEASGQRLAIQRAYRRAGFGVESVGYFEGHGTGTAVGDATELDALSSARRDAMAQAGAETPPAVIGSIKANIGHTKAAAGIACLIKATLAIENQILPPNTGVDEPHPELTADDATLTVLTEAQVWPEDRPLRAGVSAMGFGGINTHLALEGVRRERRTLMAARDRRLLAAGHQDAEIFFFAASDAAGLQAQVGQVAAYAGRLSLAELTDLAAALQQRLGKGALRAALVAGTPEELVTRLTRLQNWLEEGVTDRVDVRLGLFMGSRDRAPHIGFLFPGQGVSSHIDGGALRRRFEDVAALYERADLHAGDGDTVATAVAQPAIVTASLAGLAVLKRLGIEGDVATGHSLGELTALHWAGAFDEGALLETATARGRAMMDLGDPTGTMASISATQSQVMTLVNGDEISIACLNAPRRTVISGGEDEVGAVVARAKSMGISAHALAVSHAFHSPLVAAATDPLAAHLAEVNFRPLQRSVISTVTGSALDADADLRDLLCRQVTEPVRFVEAVEQVGADADLLIEVGPGFALSSLAGESLDVPAVVMDAGGPSVKGALLAAGAAFALGAPVKTEALFADRFTRPFDLDWRPKFLVNPCELAPVNGELPAAAIDAEAEGQAAVAALTPLVEMRLSTTSTSSQAPAETASVDTLQLLRQLVADRIELPLDAVRAGDRMLSDLHLNSITVSQIVAEAARGMGMQSPIAPNEFANVTVADAAAALDELARNGGGAAERERFPAGADGWVRAFTVDWTERPLAARRTRPGAHADDAGQWRIFAIAGDPLAAALKRAFASTGGSGVVVCLPPDPLEEDLTLLVQGAQALFEEADGDRFVLVQYGARDGAAFARTLHLEEPEITCCVIDLPADLPEPGDMAGTIVHEATTARGYREVRYDRDGRRLEPVLRLHPLASGADEPALGADDVLLVTGGGKGITAECALSLARKTGASLALLGRSRPEEDEELAANLARMTAAGVRFQYFAADVTDAEGLRAVVAEIEAGLGPVTALLHGAARNAPKRLRDLKMEDIQRTFAPKVRGMRNLLGTLDGERLRLVIGFGSIIARSGLPGEADYGLANDWLGGVIEAYGREHSHTRCLTIDWSVWAGAGMGERLGVLDGLANQGITPIPLEDGVAMLRRLLEQPAAGAQAGYTPSAVVVAGRYGDLPTLKAETGSVPFWRFLENVRLHYPGVELVTEATLSGETDPYMNDHVFQGDRLFLAVMGLEAMAQAAMALTGSNEPPVFEDVELMRPIVVPEGQSVTIRLAALVREPGVVEVVLRSQETGFQVDHFRTVCRFGEREAFTAMEPLPMADAALLDLEPERDLYGSLLFHGGRFRRVRGYREIRADRCLAELTPDDDSPWFSRYLPGDLVLGDPGARDATIHAIQVCVPQGTLLPVGVERIAPSLAPCEGPRFVHVRERRAAPLAPQIGGKSSAAPPASQIGGSAFVEPGHPQDWGPGGRNGFNGNGSHAPVDDKTLTFDVTVTDAQGRVLEVWQGLRLVMVGGGEFTGPWSPPVLGAYLERQLRARRSQASSWADALRVVVGRNPDPERNGRSDAAIQRAVGADTPVMRRPDGKPEVNGDWAVSAAHAGDLVMAVARPDDSGPVACDMEPVAERCQDVWRGLLGPDRFSLAELIARIAEDDADLAATRVWAAGECLKKAGVALNVPLILADAGDDGWITLAAGPSTIATSVVDVQDADAPVVFAVYG